MQADAIAAKIAWPHPGEPIRSFSFVTGDRVAVGGDYGVYLFDARTGGKIREFRGHTGVVWAVAPSPDGRYLLSASFDQTVRIWAPDRDEPLLSLFVAGDDWIAWRPEGYYAASPGGENLMGWQVGNGPEQVGTFVAASQFRKSLFRPDVIKLALKTVSVAPALERLNEPLKVVKDVSPPRRDHQPRPHRRATRRPGIDGVGHGRGPARPPGHCPSSAAGRPAPRR